MFATDKKGLLWHGFRFTKQMHKKMELNDYHSVDEVARFLPWRVRSCYIHRFDQLGCVSCSADEWKLDWFKEDDVGPKINIGEWILWREIKKGKKKEEYEYYILSHDEFKKEFKYNRWIKYFTYHQCIKEQNRGLLTTRFSREWTNSSSPERMHVVEYYIRLFTWPITNFFKWLIHPIWIVRVCWYYKNGNRLRWQENGWVGKLFMVAEKVGLIKYKE